MDVGGAFKGTGFKTPDIGDAFELVLNLLGNQLFHFLGGKPGAYGENNPFTHSDIGIQILGHGPVGIDPENHNEEKNHADNDGTLNGEFG